MKIFIMTDMEGVCGVINHDDWVMPEGRYYAEGKTLLTNEINAAVEGFFNAGATEIHIADGHGAGGINHIDLDERTMFIRGFPKPYPFNLDHTFDAIAWVGQHAKAGTEYAHIAHTGWFNVIDCNINGISVGEFGQVAFCADFLGVTPIFGSGDEAFTIEAKKLVKGIETVSVKKGLNFGNGDECNGDEYRNRNLAALHYHPKKACEMIKAGAQKALQRFIADKKSFEIQKINPPFIKEVKYRPYKNMPAYIGRTTHKTDFIEMIEHTRNEA